MGGNIETGLIGWMMGCRSKRDVYGLTFVQLSIIFSKFNYHKVISCVYFVKKKSGIYVIIETYNWLICLPFSEKYS